jgi:hypothetical protein
MKLEYIQNGDYYIPNLTIQKEERSIGKWGRLHREFLRVHHPIQFNQMVLSDTLFTYLADLNEQAQQRMETLIAQMQAAEGVTEDLKATNPMAWAQHMNNIQARAEEIVREELIFV